MLRNTSALLETADAPASFEGISPVVTRYRSDSTRVGISPSDAIERRSIAGRGIVVELVQASSPDRIELRYRGTAHLLIAYENGVRRDGETLTGSRSPSTLRDLTRKLTLAPAGCRYLERNQLHTSGRILLVYLDPAVLGPAASSAPLAARQVFQDPAVWSTVVKLKDLFESTPPQSSAPPASQAYIEALGTVLMHELTHLNGTSNAHVPARGGLAAWQQRLAAQYIEDHLSEPILLATLAGLARLSPYHFNRAFKQSFGVPPHRYHTSRRIERAKTLLEGHRLSVTEIGMTLGFSETSSFSAAFRKITGLTPSHYTRSIAQS